MSDVSIACQTRPSARFASSSSFSMVSSLFRCSLATRSICSSTTSNESADVALGEYVGANPTYDHLLEAAGI